MLKNKKVWSYDICQNYDIKTEVLEGYKFKGRLLEDFSYFYDLIGVGVHPSIKVQPGKEYAEINNISFFSTAVDISTLKILFHFLQLTKIVTLKFSQNLFDAENLEFLINSLLTKANNIYCFIFEWNDQIQIKGKKYLLNVEDALDEEVLNILVKSGQLISKLCTLNKLEALSLRGNLLGDVNAQLIFENLKQNQNLKVLNLFKNKLTSKSMTSFVSLLESNKSLEDVNLGSNLFTDEDIEKLKNHLGKLLLSSEQIEIHNKKLKEKELIVEKNKKLKAQKKQEEHIPHLDDLVTIGDSKFIFKNNTIKNINLMLNNLTEKSFDPLTQILENCADIFVIIDSKFFSNDQKKILSEPQFKNKIFLSK